MAPIEKITLGTLSGDRVLTGTLSNTNPVDTIFFNLSGSPRVNVIVTYTPQTFGLQADVEIFRDRDGDQFFDASSDTYLADFRVGGPVKGPTVATGPLDLSAGAYGLYITQFNASPGQYRVEFDFLTGSGGTGTNPPPNDPIAPPPTNPPTNDPLTAPVYRFYNPISRGHFFTTSTQERDTVLANPQWQYTFEGVGFQASASAGTNLLPVYRFYNPISKGHFFTTSESEKNNVIANPQWQYSFEGIGFYAYGSSANLGADVYRFYNATSRGHFFTISEAERNNVLANPQWQYTAEGVGFEAKP